MNVSPTGGTTAKLGTLVVVILKGKNLPNRQKIGKQDPYVICRIGKDAQKTKTDKRGGQSPLWDDELRFDLVKPLDSTNVKFSVFNEDSKVPALVGDCQVDLRPILKKGEYDEWVSLNYKERYAGEIYVEMTFYSAATPPRPGSSGAPRSPLPERSGPQPDRRPLPASPLVGAPPAGHPPSAQPRPRTPLRSESLPSSNHDMRERAIQPHQPYHSPQESPLSRSTMHHLNHSMQSLNFEAMERGMQSQPPMTAVSHSGSEHYPSARVQQWIENHGRRPPSPSVEPVVPDDAGHSPRTDSHYDDRRSYEPRGATSYREAPNPAPVPRHTKPRNTEAYSRVSNSPRTPMSDQFDDYDHTGPSAQMIDRGAHNFGSRGGPVDAPVVSPRRDYLEQATRPRPAREHYSPADFDNAPTQRAVERGRAAPVLPPTHGRRESEPTYTRYNHAPTHRQLPSAPPDTLYFADAGSAPDARSFQQSPPMASAPAFSEEPHGFREGSLHDPRHAGNPVHDYTPSMTPSEYQAIQRRRERGPVEYQYEADGSRGLPKPPRPAKIPLGISEQEWEQINYD